MAAAAVGAIALLASSCLGMATLEGPAALPRAGQYAPPRAGSTDSLVVVSYNIRYGEALDAALADLRGHPRLREADIYLLQEMDPAGAGFLARALRCDFVYHAASVSRHHGRPFGNAVLSRWPIVAHRALELPHAAPLSGQQRVAVAVDLDVDGRRVRAVSVHLAAVVSRLDDRLDQARAVADSLTRGAGIAIVGGDFNTATAHEARLVRRLLRRAELREARLPPGATFERSLLGLARLGFRLDRIYAAGLRAAAAGIASEARASDHYPIWAVFALPDPARGARVGMPVDPGAG